jgi:hypothetical protein
MTVSGELNTVVNIPVKQPAVNELTAVDVRTKARSPQRLTVSGSKYSGFRLFQSKQTRTGIWFFNRLLSLVVYMPLRRYHSFAFLSFRSMTAGLMDLSNIYNAPLRLNSTIRQLIILLIRGTDSFLH